MAKRQIRLARLGYKSYRAYLGSNHWKALRKRYRASSEPQECICGERDRKKLQLHHKTYDRIGEEALSDLTPLCVPCHKMIHTLDWRQEMGLEFDGLISRFRVIQYAGEDFTRDRIQRAQEERALRAQQRAERHPTTDVRAAAKMERQARREAAEWRKQVDAT